MGAERELKNWKNWDVQWLFAIISAKFSTDFNSFILELV